VSLFLVFFKSFRDYENIIHIDHHPSFSNFFLEGLVHVGLERGGELHKPKNMTFGSKRPKEVVNAAFQWSSG